MSFFSYAAYAEIILASSICVYIGAKKSLAVKQNIESMSKKDAMLFPVIGSAVLLGLYIVIKLVSAEWVNFLLSFYFVIIGSLSVSKTLHDLLESSLPALTKVKHNIRIPKFIDESGMLSVDRLHVLCGVPAVSCAVLWASTRHWVPNDIIGVSICIEGITELKLPSYFAGLIAFGGLFLYDNFWVFGTDVMVTVAKGLDLPIKLLFPREHFFSGPFALLGLGDIVIPGIFVALCLRYDVERRKASEQKGEEVKEKGNPTFRDAMIGYIVGITVTVGILCFFKRGQPALLYLVPSCTLFTMVGALLRKRFFSLFYFRLPEVIEAEINEKRMKLAEERKEMEEERRSEEPSQNAAEEHEAVKESTEQKQPADKKESDNVVQRKKKSKKDD